MQVLIQQAMITFIIIIAAVFLDFIFGIAVALRNTKQARGDNEFEWRSFLLYLKKFISPYILIWAGVTAVAILLAWLVEYVGLVVSLPASIPISIFIDGSAGAIVILTGKSIVNNAKKLGLNTNGE